MASKNVAAKTAKKVPAPKPAKVVKPRGGITHEQARIKFVSFTFGATIPTQAFGNVQPHIVVEAPSYEEARDFAIPRIEELYRHFAEIKPTFLGKVTESITVVTHAPVASPEAATAPVEEKVPVAPQKVKSEPVLKAEKAISLAMSSDALLVIKAQIEKSVKIAAEDKPDLIASVLKRLKEFE